MFVVSHNVIVKDQGEIDWILGMRITRDRKNRTMHLDQSRAIFQLLRDHKMMDSARIAKRVLIYPTIMGTVMQQ